MTKALVGNVFVLRAAEVVTPEDRAALRTDAVAEYKRGSTNATIAAAAATHADDMSGAFDKSRDADGKLKIAAEFTRATYGAVFGVGETTVDLWRVLGHVLARCDGFDPYGEHEDLWRMLAFRGAGALKANVRKTITARGKAKRDGTPGDYLKLTPAKLRKALAEYYDVATGTPKPGKGRAVRIASESDGNGAASVETPASVAERNGEETSPADRARAIAGALVELWPTLASEVQAEVWAMIDALGDTPTLTVASGE